MFKMKKKCVLCMKVKGKRICKAKESSIICPRCCAEIRDDECTGCTYYAQAEQYAKKQAKDKKIKHFTAEINPEAEEDVSKALELIENGNMQQGEKILQDLFSERPDLYIVQYGMGMMQAFKGDYAGAINYLDGCLDIFPYYVDAWFNKAVAHKNLLDLKNTIRSFQKVEEYAGSDDELKGMAMEFLSDIEQHILEDEGLDLETYLQAFERFDQAFADMKDNKPEKALQGFQETMKLTGDSAQCHGNIGLCYGLLGKKQEALNALDKALEIDPDYQPAKQNKQMVMLLQEEEKLDIDNFSTVEYYKDKMLNS